MKNDYNIRLSEAEAQFQKEYQEMIENGKANKPIIVDPTARKKRCGSVSTINSPIVTKSQPTHTHIMSIPITPDPDPSNVPILPNPKPTTTLDPMTQIMDMMSKQFERLTDRLDKLEANNNTYNTTWEDNSTTWKQPENDLALAATRFEDPYIANIGYDNAKLYDDPPNDHSFVGESDAHTTLPQTTDPLSQPDSDCILLSGPPTPTAPQPAPSGFRPPERAQRVDFDSGKLATDSFGIPVGGRCNANGTISFSNVNPICNAKPKKSSAPLPEHLTPYSNEELHKVCKDVIISHALFLFQERISKNWQKPQVIQQYLTLAANAHKPGARQSTLSFAVAAAKTPQSAPIQKQSTLSAWSKSPTPPPRRNPPQTNNTTWIIRPRMGTQGLTSRPFNGDTDKLTDWYRARLQANAGPNKPSLTLIRGAWAAGSKSIFTLTFTGHITFSTVRAYTSLFLEQFHQYK